MYSRLIGCIVLGTLWDIGVWCNVGKLPMYDEDEDIKQNAQLDQEL